MRCVDKVAYKSQAKAKQAMRTSKMVSARLGKPPPKNVYECDCGSWHLTKWPKDAHVARATS